MKSLIAVTAGIVVAGITGFLVQMAGDALLLRLMGLDPITAQGAAEMGTVRATEALLVVVASYVFGPMAGGYAAARLAPANPGRHAMLVGGFQMIFGVAALVLFPHPQWFSVATVMAFIPGALAGSALARLSSRV